MTARRRLTILGGSTGSDARLRNRALMNSTSSFGALLRRERRARGLTQEGLAQRAFCALDTVKKLEGGRRRPSHQMAVQLADVLGLAGERRSSFLAAALGHELHDGGVSADVVGAAQRPTGASATPRRLPRPATAFIGRGRELEGLLSRLREPGAALVSLVAPGGEGKTRLALAAAARLERERVFSDGVAFVALAPLADPASLEPAIAESVGLLLEAAGRRSARLQLLDFLRGRRLLLVVDNCEHLREAVADLAAAILAETPGITLLATSRERLGLRAEHVLPLDGMAPEGDGALLFAAAARAALPAFTLDEATRPQVAAICSLVGGMPLAIELAAGWADTLGLSEIAAELAHGDALLVSEAPDLEPRHRSLRQICDATWERLSRVEQAAFAHLAVFRGGGDRKALQAVAGVSLGTLQSLVARALVRYDPERERYTVHELLRQYAQGRLGVGTGANGAHERHAAYYLGWLAGREAELKGSGQRRALEAIERELENVRAAWEWATAAGDGGLLALGAGGLSLAYEWLGRSEEGWGLFRRAVAEAASAEGVRVRLLAAQARFAFLRGDQQAALALLAQARAALDGDGESDGAAALAEADVLLQLGHCLASQEFPAAHAAYQRSLALFEALGDRWGVAASLFGLGRSTINLRSDYHTGRGYLRRSAEEYSALGNAIGRCEALAMLSMTSRYTNHAAESLALARQAYAIAQTSDNPRLLAHAASNLGAALFTCNEYEQAYKVLGGALGLMLELGHQAELPSIYARLGNAAALLGRYAEARGAYERGLALAEGAGDEVATTALLAGLGEVALAEGTSEEALHLSVAVISLSGRLGERYFQLSALRLESLAARRLGRVSQARDAAVRGLRLWLESPSVTWNLWPETLLLADDGSLGRAAAVFALGQQANQAATSRFAEDLCLSEIRAILDALPLDVRAEAEAQWVGSELPRAVQLLLGELEAEGWGKGV